MAFPRRYLTFLSLAALLFVSGLLSSAQPTEAAADAEEPAFTVLAVGEQPLPAELLYLRSANEGVPIQANTTHRSSLFKPVDRNLPLIFGIKHTAPRPGEGAFEPLVQVNWPASNATRALILLIADGTRIHALAMDDGQRIFPSGSLRVVNLTGRPFVGRWGAFEGSLAPGPNAPRPFHSNGADATNRFKVGLGLRESTGGIRLIFSGWVDGWPDTRTLVLVRELEEELPEGVTGKPNTSFVTRWVVERLPKSPDGVVLRN